VNMMNPEIDCKTFVLCLAASAKYYIVLGHVRKNRMQSNLRKPLNRNITVARWLTGRASD